jgi:hypothetical protein
MNVSDYRNADFKANKLRQLMYLGPLNSVAKNNTLIEASTQVSLGVNTETPMYVCIRGGP